MAMKDIFNTAKEENLFHRNPHWLGGDGASSVDLGDGRVLWLFGDSFIAADDNSTRADATMVRNSIAIQTGNDPATAKMDFYWRESESAPPSSFFPESGDDTWLWPGHGIRLDDGSLLIFAMRIRETDHAADEQPDPLGFETVAYLAISIDNPDDNPADWHLQTLTPPDNQAGIIFGAGGVVKDDAYLYALGVRDAAPEKPVYAARWSLDSLAKQDMSGAEYWCGDKWKKNIDDAVPLFENAQTEMSLHYDPDRKEYLCIQTSGFGDTALTIRSAARPEGLWSEPETICDLPKSENKNLISYAGKAHPHLTAENGTLLSYVTNSLNIKDIFDDEALYYPRFVKFPAKKY